MIRISRSTFHPRRARVAAMVAPLAIAVAIFASACGAPEQVTEIEVKANEFAYAPATLTVKKNQRVRIKVENTGVQLHDLNSDAPAANVVEKGTAGHAHDTKVAKLHVAVDRGASGTLTFTPTQSGSFDMWCSIPGHREAGMAGKITVE